MISKIPIIVRLKNSLTVKGKGGEALYGLLLSMIKKIDINYATYLHDLTGVKPISISPIFSEDCKIKNGMTYLDSGSEFSFIINSLNIQTTEILLQALAKNNCIRIGSSKGIIEKVCLKEDEGASFLSYEDIIEESDKKREREVIIKTPLSFRQNGIQIVFPLPLLFFKSLKTIFNTFSSIKIPSSLEVKFDKIKVSKYNLKSEMWRFTGYKVVGCTGNIKLLFEEKFNEEEVNFLNILLNFAKFSGVGYKRTMGMGMVEVK